MDKATYPDLSGEHLRRKEKRIASMKKQECRRQRLLHELANSRYCKPSIWAATKWDRETGDFVDANRVKRSRDSKTQRQLKKKSTRKVRHLPADALPPKGNHYRKVFDYWWIWI